jgi:AraC-like DNA-binding protein
MSGPVLHIETPNDQLAKVWQPAGFEGLSLEKMQAVRPVQPPVLLFDYGIQVAFSGYAKIRYGKMQQVVKITQPTVLLQNPGEIWSFEALDDTPLSVKNFDIPPAAFADFLDRTVPFRFTNLVLNNAAVNHHLVNLMLQAFASFETPTSRLEKDDLLTQLLDEAFRHCTDIRPEEALMGAEHQAVRVVKELLHASPELNVSLAELAALTQLNKHYLLAVFKREVGMSPHAYQTNLRLHKAQVLLGNGLPVAQVALDTGFSDQSHLTNVFKKYRFVTPGQFRKDSLPQGT